MAADGVKLAGSSNSETSEPNIQSKPKIKSNFLLAIIWVRNVVHVVRGHIELQS